MAGKKVQVLTGKQTLVYRGLSEKEIASMRSKFDPPENPKNEWDDGFRYPNPVGPVDEYRPYKRDPDVVKAQKRARRKAYREQLLKELEDQILVHDAVIAPAGVVFEKDQPKEVDFDELDEQERLKLSVFVKMGKLELVEEKKQKTSPPAPEEPSKEAPAPKKRGPGRPKKTDTEVSA